MGFFDRYKKERSESEENRKKVEEYERSMRNLKENTDVLSRSGLKGKLYDFLHKLKNEMGSHDFAVRGYDHSFYIVYDSFDRESKPGVMFNAKPDGIYAQLFYHGFVTTGQSTREDMNIISEWKINPRDIDDADIGGFLEKILQTAGKKKAKKK